MKKLHQLMEFILKIFSNIQKKIGLGKYTPIFNYYANIRGHEFDTKYVFLSNNIAENINKFLNSSFKKAYSSF